MYRQNLFVFDGKSSKEFGIALTGSGVYDAPKRDYDSISIPGRNGNITLDNGRYNNITLTYKANVVRKFGENIDSFRAFALSRKGYCRLEDTYHPDEYRMAMYAGPFQVDAGFLNRWGEFDIEFDCKPQRFLKSGEMPVEIPAGSTVKIMNPTYYDARPMIRCTGTGDFIFGNDTISVNSLTSYVDIDCDTQDAFEGTINRNPDIEVALGHWPVFEPGETGITNNTSGLITIIPRWWTI